MASGRFAITSTGVAEARKRLRDVAQSDGGRSLAGGLRRRLGAEMPTAQKAVQRAVLATPARSGQSTGLRQRVAQAVQVKATVSGRDPGFRVWVDPSRMPDGQKSLPELLEGARRWEHPVYGNAKVRVTQASHPYFNPTIRAAVPRWRAAVQRAVQDVANYVNQH